MDEKVEKIKKMFDNIEDLTPEKLQGVVHESIKVFEEIIGKLNSPNEEERQKAMKCAAELRDLLQEQARAAMQKSGLSQEQVSKMLHDPSNFSPEEWKAFQGAKDELTTYEKELKDKGLLDSKHSHSKGKKKHPSKNPKDWLQG